MRFLRGLSKFTLAAVLFACGDPNPLYCEQHSDCNNTNLSFCDVNGEYPDSNGVRKTCIADPIVLDVSVVGNGSVTSNPGRIDCGAVCSDAFSSGAAVTLTAISDSGSVFTGWSGACDSTTDCELTMSVSRSVTATFVDSVQLSVFISDTSIGSVGRVTSTPPGINCPGTCMAGFLDGSQVTLSAVEGDGSTFMGWSGQGCNGFADCSVMIAGPGRNTVNAEFAQSGAFRWATTGGDAGVEQAVDAAYDYSGNLIVVVNFTGTLNMGGLTHVRTTFSRYVGKFDPQGNEIWSSVLTGSSGRALAVSDTGDVYIVSSGDVRRLSGLTGAQVAAYFFSIGFQGTDIAIDSAGNVVVATSSGSAGKLTWLTAGLLRTTATVYSATAMSISSVAVTPADTVLIAGIYTGTVDLNGNSSGGILSSTGADNYYMADVSANNGLRWSKGFVGSQTSISGDAPVVAVAPDGGVYLAGGFIGSVDFAPGEAGGDLSSGGIFAAKYDETGLHQWSQRFGSGAVADAVVDSRGNLVLLGRYALANFGGGNLSSFGGDFDIFLVNLRQDGSHRWSFGFGSALDSFLSTENGTSVAASPNGEVAAVGYFRGTPDLGGGSVTNGGAADAFVVVRGP